MGIISADLLKFKNSVGPSIGNMQSTASTLQDKVGNLLNLNNSAKNGIDSYYNSDMKDAVLSSFDSLNSDCSSVVSSITGELSGILSSCSGLIGKIDELEKINQEIEKLQAIINSNHGDDDGSRSRRSNAQSQLNQKNQEFESKEKEAESSLQSLKSSGGSIASTTSSSSLSTGNSISDAPTGSSFKLEEINVNGKKMLCYIYRPKYNKDVGKLPINMHMYGIGFDNKGTNYMTYGQMGKYLKEGSVKPSGIVVIPYVQNGRQYESKEFRDLLAKLPFEVAKKYNGDEERVSLSGTSYGAVTSYRLVKENPGKFSAIIAACGAGDIDESFSGMKVINYSGRQSANNHTDCRYIKKQTEAINAVGGSAEYHQYDNQWAHGNIGNLAFAETTKNESGQVVSIIEEAFKYKRNKNARSNTTKADNSNKKKGA